MDLPREGELQSEMMNSSTIVRMAAPLSLGPVAFTLIDGSLAGREPPFLPSRRLRWATLMVWVGLCLFLASLAATSLTGQMARPLPPWVSLANRFLIVTYCIWFMAAAWSGTRVATPGR
jgi:hypothetical protein